MPKTLKSIEKANIKNKTVAVRVDFDVPIQEGKIMDDLKVKAVLDTIKLLQSNQCKVVILSHLGNPKGEYADALSLMPLRFELGRLLERQIKFANINQCENSIKFMEFGDILLLENLKFNPEETSKDARTQGKFMEKITTLCDIYVNEAFGTETTVASIAVPAKKMDVYYGMHYIKEVESSTKILNNNEKPLTLIVGGSNIENKIKFIKAFIKKADKILIGGEVAFTFLKAQKVKIGKNKVEDKYVTACEKLLKQAEKSGCEIILPVDHLGNESKEGTGKAQEIKTQHIPSGIYIHDIGPKTLVNFREAIESSKTIIWYGPLGRFEIENFNKGTEAVGEYIALSTPKDANKYALGQSTSMAINMLQVKPKRFTHISTGEQKMLDLLSED